eukprot:TRINITY_DN16799_c0_g1_i1.p1 TRINITY_DN16799_c0_g1~~TRINITY_DN16799_c0_g1_i1.p1  ORF type:complete len:135 (+),score=22.36 TRINITY_DN16799_c0_g1_i1:53-457(+)
MGGKRKTRKAPPKKEGKKLPSTFDCPFCDHVGAVSVKMMRTKNQAKLQCGVCACHFAVNISPLTEPVDVYHDWIDKAAEENADGGKVADPDDDYEPNAQDPVSGDVGDEELDEVLDGAGPLDDYEEEEPPGEEL